jgi:hypothetical protein
MHTRRASATLLAALAGAVIMTACGSTAGTEPSTPAAATPEPTESAQPSATPRPSTRPSPESTPTPSPSAEPAQTPPPIVVYEHAVPMIGRSNADGVAVRALPDLDAPLVSGERTSDGAQARAVRLNEGDNILVTLGPVFADGHSWYRARSSDADVQWSDGWVSGEFLTQEDLVPAYNVVVELYGVGVDASETAQVLASAALSVNFAATPLPGAESCVIDVTFVRTDGTPVNVGTDTITGPEVVDFASHEMPPLYQEEAGAVTLTVESDCSYAATVTNPQG